MTLLRIAILLAILTGSGCASSGPHGDRKPHLTRPGRPYSGANFVNSKLSQPQPKNRDVRQVSASEASLPGKTASVIGVTSDDTAVSATKAAYMQEGENSEPDLPQLESAEESVKPSLDLDAQTFAPTVIDAGPTNVMNVMTLAEIEQAVLATHPGLQKINAQLEATRGKYNQAGLPPNPTAGLRGSDIFEEGGSGRYGVYFGREVVRGNKLQVAQSVACAEMKVIEKNLTTMQVSLLADVHQRYYEVLVAQEKVNLSRQLAEISDNAVNVSEQLFAAEEVAKTAVLQSQLELQNANVLQRRANNQLVAARRRLAALFNESDLPAASVEGNVRDAIELEDFEFWYDELVNKSPEIEALFADVNRARRELDRQIVKPIPNVTWQTTIDYDTVSDNIIGGFQIGMPIPTLDRNQGGIYEARYRVVESERTAEVRALQLRQRLATAYEGYLDAKLQVDAFDGEIIPNAKETLSLFLAGYKQGETDVLQLLTAQRTYFQTRLAYLESLRELWRQSVRIRGLMLDTVSDVR